MRIQKLVFPLVFTLLSACSGDHSKDPEVQRDTDSATEVLIAAGVYLLGCDSAADQYCSADETPVHTVSIDAFFMDRYEVTVAEYRACVEAGVCRRAGTWNGCNYTHASRDDHPVNCVTWNDANNYCAWVGKRLPTEAEWEIAARGEEGRLYPWGWDELTRDHAVYDSNPDDGIRGDDGFLGLTQPVGSQPLGDTPDGLHDMAGNVDEWVQDWFDETYYASMAEFINPQGPATGTRRGTRGGGWNAASQVPNPADRLRGASRISEKPADAWNDLGLRCARSL